MTPAARAIAETSALTAAVTAAIVILARAVPDPFATSAVALVLLAVTWLTVWRGDDETVRRYGLTLGGLVTGEPCHPAALVGGAIRTTGIALAIAVATIGPLVLASSLGFPMGKPLRISMEPLCWLQTFAWQLLLVAYPEEAFYRGYLQSRLDAVWTPRWRIVGAALGPGVLLAGVAFTVAHLAVEPRLARLLVFPAALLFGWLRARTQGIGASTVLHAIYNALANITSHSG